MLEIWRMQSTPLVSPLPGHLWPVVVVVVPGRVLSIGQIELFDI